MIDNVDLAGVRNHGGANDHFLFGSRVDRALRLNSPRIAIVMAVYNGEKYIAEQVESIIHQSYADWTLLIRDDASSDKSHDIIRSFESRDERITVIDDNSENVGIKKNFSLLVQKALLMGYDYFFLSDQDDVWERDKLLLQMQMLKEMECENPNLPLLVHSDLSVTDDHLREISPSFMRDMGIRHEINALHVLLVQNFVTGCTILANRQLMDIAFPIPNQALMHDWWLALCATVFGKVGFIDKPLVKYRQHAGNQVGVRYLTDFVNVLAESWKRQWQEGRQNLFLSMKQAAVLAECICGNNPKNSSLILIESYASLRDISPLKRVKLIKELGVHAQSKSRQALLLSRLMFTPKGHDV